MRIEGRIIVRIIHTPVKLCLALSIPTEDIAAEYTLHACMRLHRFPPSNLFMSYQNRSRSVLHGFDEFMNVVMDEAAEVYVKDAKPRRELGMYPQSSF